jgi:hypothetical protein
MPIRVRVRPDDISPGQILATPRGELLKVRGIQYNRLRAQVVYPLQKRVTIREFGMDAVALMTEPSSALLAKYESALESRR